MYLWFKILRGILKMENFKKVIKYYENIIHGVNFNIIKRYLRIKHDCKGKDNNNFGFETWFPLTSYQCVI